MKETIEEFLRRGGKIEQCPPEPLPKHRAITKGPKNNFQRTSVRADTSRATGRRFPHRRRK